MVRLLELHSDIWTIDPRTWVQIPTTALRNLNLSNLNTSGEKLILMMNLQDYQSR